jgi:hypothetical protein
MSGMMNYIWLNMFQCFGGHDASGMVEVSLHLVRFMKKTVQRVMRRLFRLFLNLTTAVQLSVLL